MLRTLICCAPLLVLAALPLGCGSKSDDTGEETTSTTSSSTTTATTSSATMSTTSSSTTTSTTATVTTTEPTTDPTTEVGSDCDDRSVFCMVAPGFEDTTTGGGSTAGPDEPMCESLLGELETRAKGVCSAGFAGLGLLSIDNLVGPSNQCCYVYHCADPTHVCTPLAEAGACAEEADIGDAAFAPQNACNNGIGSGIYLAPRGDACCSDFQCVCGPTGG